MPRYPIGMPLGYTHQPRNELPLTAPHVLWRPAEPEATPISRYRQHVNHKFSLTLQTSHELHRWSVTSPHEFWIDLYEYTGIVPALPSAVKHAYDVQTKMRDVPAFFPGHELNYAENVLVPNMKATPNAIALTGLREGMLDDPEHVTWTQLWELVRMTRSALIRAGIQKHDIVAAHMSNSVWIIVVFLATTSIGAYFTSISPDMGLSGCISRLTQVQPKIIFSDIDYALRGTRHSLLGKVLEMQRALKLASSTSTLPQTVFVPAAQAPHLKQNLDLVSPLGTTLHTFITKYSSPADALAFTRVPTTHPLVVLYSSGTTGSPKCILSPHISILNYKKIAYLHNSLSSSSTVFQYSSTSWVVWNIMLGHLSVGARLITYDGGALYPNTATLLQICEKYNVTYWGTSPRYLLELEQAKSAGIDPQNFDLRDLRMVTTTGATLTGPQMRWFYTAFPQSVHLSSIAGSTEICSSWIASDPAGPVHENEMQMWALGHDCDVADPDTGASLIHGASTSPKHAITGELVCRLPFASQPVGFWQDKANKKYHEAYFEQFITASSNAIAIASPTNRAKPMSNTEAEYLDIWTQHDITTFNPSTHGVQIIARSDSTLNPSGIRFGPSEIYAILSSPHSVLKDKISDALCVGRKRAEKGDKDETVFLFVIPQKFVVVDEFLIAQIREEIRRGLSARHVPKFIIGVPEGGIPYTVNGKKVEVLVKKIISGDVDVDARGGVVGASQAAGAGAVSTIVNPACLAFYSKFKDLERESSSRERASKL